MASDYRFFPTIKDEMFGYILHPVDLATNKVMAGAGRRELRDLVDLVTIHETILPLGAVTWSAVEKLDSSELFDSRRGTVRPMADNLTGFPRL